MSRKSNKIRRPLSAQARAERVMPRDIHVAGMSVNMKDWISVIERAIRHAQVDAYKHAAKLAERTPKPHEHFDYGTARLIAMELRGIAYRMRDAGKGRKRR